MARYNGETGMIIPSFYDFSPPKDSHHQFAQNFGKRTDQRIQKERME